MKKHKIALISTQNALLYINIKGELIKIYFLGIVTRRKQ